VQRHYRRLTPDVRADHVAALALLARQVVEQSSTRVQRSFVVMTVTAPSKLRRVAGSRR
jgi:hypothetical protein